MLYSKPAKYIIGRFSDVYHSRQVPIPERQTKLESPRAAMKEEGIRYTTDAHSKTPRSRESVEFTNRKCGHLFCFIYRDFYFPSQIGGAFYT